MEEQDVQCRRQIGASKLFESEAGPPLPRWRGWQSGDACRLQCVTTHVFLQVRLGRQTNASYAAASRPNQDMRLLAQRTEGSVL